MERTWTEIIINPELKVGDDTIKIQILLKSILRVKIEMMVLCGENDDMENYHEIN